jgi:hypothetical protein
MNLILPRGRCGLAAVALAVALGVSAAGDARAMGAGGGSSGPPRAASDGAAICEKGATWDAASRKCVAGGASDPAQEQQPLTPHRCPPGSRVESTAVGMGAYTCVPE